MSNKTSQRDLQITFIHQFKRVTISALLILRGQAFWFPLGGKFDLNI